jgi:hypothetical protein
LKNVTIPLAHESPVYFDNATNDWYFLNQTGFSAIGFTYDIITLNLSNDQVIVQSQNIGGDVSTWYVSLVSNELLFSYYPVSNEIGVMSLSTWKFLGNITTSYPGNVKTPDPWTTQILYVPNDNAVYISWGCSIGNVSGGLCLTVFSATTNMIIASGVEANIESTNPYFSFYSPVNGDVYFASYWTGFP